MTSSTSDLLPIRYKVNFTFFLRLSAASHFMRTRYVRTAPHRWNTLGGLNRAVFGVLARPNNRPYDRKSSANLTNRNNPPKDCRQQGRASEARCPSGGTRTPARMTRQARSKLDDGDLMQNLSGRVQFSLPAARTNLAGLVPSLLSPNVRFPERPRPALPWASIVNCALARCRIKKNAVPVGVFDQALADADLPYVLRFEVGHADAQLVRQGFYFVPVDPHKTGCAGAAVAAPGALESKSLFEPGLIVHRALTSRFAISDGSAQGAC
jgi:hypothetical protein